MSKIGVGKEVVTHCSKCKLELAHIVVVMKDEVTPHKVQCKTCGANHSFKVKKVAAAKKTTGTRKKRVTTAEKIFIVWDKAMKGTKDEPIPYTIRTKFVIGQILAHVKFGSGLVDKVIDNNKIEVIFETEVKILMHNKM